MMYYFKFTKQKYVKIKNIAQERKKRSATISEYFMLSNRSLRVLNQT